MTTTETAKREYKLAAEPFITNAGQLRRTILEITGSHEYLELLVVGNDDAVDVLEALRRARGDGQEDRGDEEGPNPLGGRLLAMARILREAGKEDAADELETSAAFVREAWRGSDDGSIADNLETIAAYAAELAKTVRDWPAAADEAERNGEQR